MSGGLEVLAQIARDNERAQAEELRREAEQEYREGIPVELWRALADPQ